MLSDAPTPPMEAHEGLIDRMLNHGSDHYSKVRTVIGVNGWSAFYCTFRLFSNVVKYTSIMRFLTHNVHVTK